MHVLSSMRALTATAIAVTLAVLAGGAQARDVSIYRGKCGEVVLPSGPTGLESAIRIDSRCGTFGIDRHGVRPLAVRRPRRIDGDGRIVSIVRDQPMGWTRTGLFFTSRQGTVTFRTRSGRVVTRLRPAAGRFWFDARRRTLLFVSSGGDLMRTDGRRSDSLASLPPLRLGRRFQIEALPSGRIALLGRGLVVLGSDGAVVATDRGGGSMPTESAEGAIATISTRYFDNSARASESVHLLRPGDRSSMVLFAHEFSFGGCPRAAKLSWRDHELLYSTTEGHLVVIDTLSDERVDLTAMVARLPGHDALGVGWA
jgi:hypothetical protein